MKRDPRLRGLSSEHHHALLLVRTIRQALESGLAEPGLAREVADIFSREIEAHFRVEEEVLLTGLRHVGDAGALALVERTEVDHALLREGAAAAALGRTDGLASFAERLFTHVRFEEEALFPRCERVLAASSLDEVSRRKPHMT